MKSSCMEMIRPVSALAWLNASKECIFKVRGNASKECIFKVRGIGLVYTFDVPRTSFIKTITKKGSIVYIFYLFTLKQLLSSPNM